MLVFKRFHHVVVAVRDVAAAAADWERYLEARPAKLTAEPPWPTDWKGMRYGCGDGWIELAEPTSAKCPLGKHLEAHGPGVYSVGVQVESIRAVIKRARQMGARVIGDEGKSGQVFIDPQSTNGVLLSLHDDAIRSIPSPPLSDFGEGPGVRSPLFRRIEHIVVAVKEQDAAIENWKRTFGLVNHLEGPVPSPERVEGSKGPKGHVASHHMPVGDGWFGLTSAGTSAELLQRFMARHGEAVYALAVAVDDAAAWTAGVQQRGGRAIRQPTSGQLFVHPATTHGVLLEIRDNNIFMSPEEA